MPVDDAADLVDVPGATHIDTFAVSKPLECGAHEIRLGIEGLLTERAPDH